MKKVILIGASIPNIYAAKILGAKGFTATIYEQHKELTNTQRRLIPQETLTKLGLDLNEDYYILKEIKEKISSGLNIVFNSPITDFSKLSYDFLIINTKFKEVTIDDKKVFLLNYNLHKDTKNHFAGNSLFQALIKMDAILENILNASKKQNYI